jgi:hypothetical protein
MCVSLQKKIPSISFSIQCSPCTTETAVKNLSTRDVKSLEKISSNILSSKSLNNGFFVSCIVYVLTFSHTQKNHFTLAFNVKYFCDNNNRSGSNTSSDGNISRDCVTNDNNLRTCCQYTQ